MTFSIRTILALVALVAFFLGAFLSRSELFISLATMIGIAIILLALALGITESNPVRRTFWIGFFVLSLGMLIVSNYVPSFDYLANRVVIPMRRTGEMSNPLLYYPMRLENSPPPTNPVPPIGQSLRPFISAPAQNAPIYPAGTLYTTNSGELYVLKYEVHVLFALLSGLIGGMITVWCFLGSRRMAMEEESGSES